MFIKEQRDFSAEISSLGQGCVGQVEPAVRAVLRWAPSSSRGECKANTAFGMVRKRDRSKPAI